MEIKNGEKSTVKNPVGFRLDEIALSYYIVGVPEGDLEARIYENKECDKPIYISKYSIIPKIIIPN